MGREHAAPNRQGVMEVIRERGQGGRRATQRRGKGRATNHGRLEEHMRLDDKWLCVPASLQLLPLSKSLSLIGLLDFLGFHSFQLCPMLGYTCGKKVEHKK